MLVKVIKKENLKHREVVIYTSDGDCRINDFVDYIYHFEKQIIGYQRGEQKILNVMDISHFYSLDKKVFAVTPQGDYHIKKRLYEVEESLNHFFIRISNSDIVNIHYIQTFKREGINTICVILKNGDKIYISRRYWPIVKKKMEVFTREKTED